MQVKRKLKQEAAECVAQTTRPFQAPGEGQ
jgi:hypothetical protein